MNLFSAFNGFCWIQPTFNMDPDPAFFLLTDSDLCSTSDTVPDPRLTSDTDPDPFPKKFQKLKSLVP